MSTSVAIVGCGPSGLYTLKHLLDSRLDVAVTLYESGSVAGSGTPYDPALTDPAMLANIASIELPPVRGTLCDWLDGLPDERKSALGIAGWPIDERTFYPRIVLGAWFADMFAQLVAEAPGRVSVRRETLVVDVIAAPRGASVKAQATDGTLTLEEFDYVVIANGHLAKDTADHAWSGKTEHSDLYRALQSPGAVAQGRVAILGTSLSAIDAVIALAGGIGDFVRAPDGTLAFRADADSDLHVTMMSRRGLLPEVDFYCAIPYADLAIATPAAIGRAARGPREGRLDRVFALFARELAAADPAYAERIGLDGLTADTFAEAYYAERMASDPFDWAERTRAEAAADHAARRTVTWKYAILRMHEPIGEVVRRFDEADKARFAAGMAGVFVDNYAAVPLLSIARLVALHRAGRLDVLRLGNDYQRSDHAAGGCRIAVGDTIHDFDRLIDARGQSTLGASDLPFPTLRLQTVANAWRHDTTDDGALHVGEALALSDGINRLSRVFCLSIPHLLRRHPFVQGLTSCADLSRTIVGAIAGELAGDHADRSPKQDLADLIDQLDNTGLVHCMTSGEVVQIPETA